MKLKVKYTITGEFTLDSDEVVDSIDLNTDGLSDEEIVTECEAAIKDDPFVEHDPMTEGKISVSVEKTD